MWEESFRECFLVARICLLIKFYFTWSSRQFPEMLQHPKLLASHPSKVMDTWVLPNTFLYNSRKSFQHTGTYPKPFTNAFARNSFSLQILDATHRHDLKVLCWRLRQNSRGFFGVNHDYLYLENQLKLWVSWFLFYTPIPFSKLGKQTWLDGKWGLLKINFPVKINIFQPC